MKKIIALAVALGAAGMLSAQVHFGIGARGTFGFGLGSTTDASNNFSVAWTDAWYDYYDEYYKALGSSYRTTRDGYESDYDDEDLNVKIFESFLAGGSLVGRLSFESVPGLFIQPEIGFYHNQIKYDYDWEGSETTAHSNYTRRRDKEAEGNGTLAYNSIDVPIIVGYDVDLGSGMVLSPYAGLNLSIPIGNLSWSLGAETTTRTVTRTYNDGSGSTSTTDVDKSNSTSLSASMKNGVIPGLVLGAGFGYKFDQHNMIMADIRYLLDFMPVKAETDLDDAGKMAAKAGGYDHTWDAEDEKYNQNFRFDALTRRGLKIGVSYVYFIN